MVVLGMLLAAAAVAVGIGVLTENASPAGLTVFGNEVPGVTAQWQVFLAGVVVAFLFTLGLTVAALALGRSLRTRRELRELRDEHEESLTTLALEKQRLQRELARVRRQAAGSAPQTRTDTPRVSPFFDQTA